MIPSLLRPTRVARPVRARVALPRRVTARRAVRTFLIAFAASSLALTAAAEFHPRLRDPMAGDKVVRLTNRAAEHPDRPVVLFLGSSHTGFAFHARRAEEQLPETVCFNLGLPAAGPVGELVSLKRVLNAGIVPKLLLVEIMPAMLHDDGAGPREALFLGGDRFSSGEIRRAAAFGFPQKGGRGAWVSARVAPWWAYRFSLWGRVAPSWLPYTRRGDWGRTADPGGWNAPVHETIAPDLRLAAEAQTRAEYAPVLAALTPGGGAAAAVRAMAEDCRAEGIELRYVLQPEGSVFRGLYGPGVESRLQAFLSCLDAPVIDARDWLPDEAFSDGHHVLRPWAGRYTDRLTAEVIRPALSGRGRPHE